MTEKELTRRAALGTLGAAVATMAAGTATVKAEEDKPGKTNSPPDFKSRGIATEPPARANAYQILGQAGWYTEISRPTTGGVYDKEMPVPETLVLACPHFMVQAL